MNLLKLVLSSISLCVIFFSNKAYADQNQVQKTLIGPLVDMKLIHIPRGSFDMGSNYADTVACSNGKPPKYLNIPESEFIAYCTKNGQTEWFVDEKPCHRVTITHDFWVSETEVTVAQFKAFVEDTGYLTVAERISATLGETGEKDQVETFGLSKASWAAPWQGAGDLDKYPVVHIAWEDANAFCQWLSCKTGETFRLLSEAEWEYAASGGLPTNKARGSYSWGKAPPTTARVGNVADVSFKTLYPKWKYPIAGEYDDGYALAAPVKSYPPNAFGLYDMSGNVWEWTSDVYSRSTYQWNSNDEIVTDPTFASSSPGFSPVMRGGSFDFELPFLRIQKRRTLASVRKTYPVYSSISVGFRIAKDSRFKKRRTE